MIRIIRFTSTADDCAEGISADIHARWRSIEHSLETRANAACIRLWRLVLAVPSIPNAALSKLGEFVTSLPPKLVPCFIQDIAFILRFHLLSAKSKMKMLRRSNVAWGKGRPSCRRMDVDTVA